VSSAWLVLVPLPVFFLTFSSLRILVKSSEFRGFLLDLTDIVERVVFISEHESGSPQYQQHHLSGQEVEYEGKSYSPTTTSTSTSYQRVYVPASYIPTTTGFAPATNASISRYVRHKLHFLSFFLFPFSPNP
jgi:hypothetical protein